MAIELFRLQEGDEQLALRVAQELKPKKELRGRWPSLQHLRRFLALDTNYLFYASTESVPVGFLTAYRMPDLFSDSSMVYLYEIEVAPGARRQGVGRRLVNALKTACEGSDVEEIWVAASSDNLAANRLYKSTGAIQEYPGQNEYVYELTKTRGGQ